jgi:hypothetical protein
MTNHHHIFGLNITSAIPLPAAPVQQPQSINVPDVTIEYGDTPHSLPNPLFKGVRFQTVPGELLLRVDGIARYHVRNGSRVTITPDKGASEDDILLFLMGSAMGALLQQRNILVLHAGAVEVNGSGIIACGPSGIGKSTLTAGLHRRGYPFLADDVCAVTLHDGHPAVVPGFPRLKLWSDVLRRLEMDRKGLKSVRWDGDLEKYFLPVENTPRPPVPVRSVFILETTNTDRMEITPLQGAEKINPIIHNTYRRRFLRGLGGKADHFKQCAAVAAEADVCRVIRPKKKFLLDEMMDLVESRLLS